MRLRRYLTSPAAHVANASHEGVAFDGRSLIPVAQQPGLERNRELLVEERTRSAIRTPRYIYAEHDSGERELYDLRRDPYELQSRHKAPAYGPVRAALASRLHELETCAGATCRVHRPDPKPSG